MTREQKKNVPKNERSVGERMKFNTAIAAMMSLVNDFYAAGTVRPDEFLGVKNLVTGLSLDVYGQVKVAEP